MTKTRKILVPSLEEDAKIIAAAIADSDCPPLAKSHSKNLLPANVAKAKAARMKQLAKEGMVEIRSGKAYRMVAIPEDIASRIAHGDDDLEKQVHDTLRKAVGL